VDVDNLTLLAERLRLQRPRPGARNFVASCPFAPYRHLKEDGSFGEDRKASFGITIDPNGESVYNCFACESRGDLMFLVLELGELRGRDYSDIEDWIFQVESVQALDLALAIDEDDDGMFAGAGRRRRVAQQRRDAVYQERELEEFTETLPPYAEERGLSVDVCKDWGLLHDPEEGRLVFPIRNRCNELVGIKGRSYTGARNKYYSYLPLDQGAFFYGEHMLPSDATKVVVVEGEIDALKVAMAGLPVLALMGGHASREHQRKLEVLGLDVVLMPDPGNTGETWARRIGDYLKSRLNVFDVDMPPGKDPGDMDLEEIQDLVENARIRL
jgi:5S rRNA maturation endonuclease (ribonuclease M5)